ncbi:MAG: hypothetical protein ACHQK8_07925 [Bacteroidia bacterium]
MRKLILVYLLLAVPVFFAVAQKKSTNATKKMPKDAPFKSPNMPFSFAIMSQNELLKKYGFDEPAQKLIEAYYYNKRKRFLIVPGLAALAYMIYVGRLIPQYNVLSTNGPEFIATELAFGGFSFYCMYQGLKSRKIAGSKSELYDRLRKYNLSKKLSDQDQKIIDIYNKKDR